MPKQDVADRFWSKVVKSESCWNWTAAKDKQGYGRFSVYKGNNVTIPYLAHRASWEMTNGSIPAGKLLCHRCDNPSCVNPDHMFLGTHADNMQDMWNKGRAKPGHMVGEKHGCARITEAIVREIRASPEKPIRLVERYNLSRRHISDIQKGRVWRHVS